MTNPSADVLTSAYFGKQAQRVRTSLDQIVSRAKPVDGRTIPSADSLPINDARRIEATVLFLDICSFSKRASETAEEQTVLVRILALFFTEMVRIIEDHGGTVEKNTGDGLMAYFMASGGDATSSQQQAVACALTMFSATTSLINPILEKSSLEPLKFRVCLDHGNITVARIGAAKRFNSFVAVGTTANIACKMLSFADDNSILIGNSLLEGLPTAWQEQFVKLKTYDSGWIFRATGSPYPFWEYIGRWRIPEQ
jgi:class 3 adenylate cyclase